MKPAIVWFRDDLRLADNPALHAAAHSRRPLVCIYDHDEKTRGLRSLGAAARWSIATKPGCARSAFVKSLA